MIDKTPPSQENTPATSRKQWVAPTLFFAFSILAALGAILAYYTGTAGNLTFKVLTGVSVGLFLISIIATGRNCKRNDPHSTKPFKGVPQNQNLPSNGPAQHPSPKSDKQDEPQIEKRPENLDSKQPEVASIWVEQQESQKPPQTVLPQETPSIAFESKHNLDEKLKKQQPESQEPPQKVLPVKTPPEQKFSAKESDRAVGTSVGVETHEIIFEPLSTFVTDDTQSVQNRIKKQESEDENIQNDVWKLRKELAN